MARLSKSAREQMARALARHKLNDRAEALCVRSAELFNAFLNERYDSATQKLMAQLDRKVPGGVGKADYLYVRAQGMRVSIGSNVIGHYGTATWEPVVPARFILDDKGDEPSTELAAKIAAFAMDSKEFTDDLREAYRKALGTLEQFTTGKKLAEEWPEAMPIIGNFIPEDDRTLPVIQLDAINDEFGLPPAELAA